MQNTYRFKKIAGIFIALIIAVCLLLIGYQLTYGPLGKPIPGSEALFKIMFVAIICWGLLLFRPGKYQIFAIITITVSILFTLLLGEVYMRLFRGDHFTEIDYTINDESRQDISARGPAVYGPKRPGVNRILIQGDSITWGAGVLDWKMLYPYQLLKMLNKDAEQYEMITLANPGMEINNHEIMLKKYIKTIDPDTVVYQWYINDLEVIKNRARPPETLWSFLPFHSVLAEYSYLYYFTDHRLTQLIYKPGIDYLDYLNKDFAEGAAGWQRFKTLFHNWATIAATHADGIVLVMYPNVPYTGQYKLKALSDNVKKIVSDKWLTIYAHLLPNKVGGSFKDKTASAGVARVAIEGQTPKGVMMYGPHVTLPEGEQVAILRMKSGKEYAEEVANILVVSEYGKVIHAKKSVSGADFPEKDQWTEFELSFTLDKEITENIGFQVHYTGRGTLSVDKIAIAVDHNIEIIDMLDILKNFDTHASMFDPHPNARAHKVIAETIYQTLTNPAQ